MSYSIGSHTRSRSYMLILPVYHNFIFNLLDTRLVFHNLTLVCLLHLSIFIITQICITRESKCRTVLSPSYTYIHIYYVYTQ